MITVVVSGAKGRMGTCIVNAVAAAEDLRLVGCYAPLHAGQSVSCADGTFACADDLAALLDETCPDVLVDFTQASAALPNIACALAHGVSVVTGTTGVSTEDMRACWEENARDGAKLFFAPNFTTGAVLMMQFAKVAGRFFPDVEIVEMHHRHKKDAPSGTALGLAHAVAEGRKVNLDDVACYGRHGMVGERPAGEVGIHALRGGSVVGDHTVLFAADEERVEITHKASSRAAFAKGALKAGQWLRGKPAGLYNMRHVLGFETA